MISLLSDSRDPDYTEEDTNRPSDMGVGVMRMEQRECPHVNRSDTRCAEHLTMGGLEYAYDHCFASFEHCPVYREMSAEQGSGTLMAARALGSDGDAGVLNLAPRQAGTKTWARLENSVVELTVGRRRLGSAA